MYTFQLLCDHGDALERQYIMWPWEKLVHQETSPPNVVKWGGRWEVSWSCWGLNKAIQETKYMGWTWPKYATAQVCTLHANAIYIREQRVPGMFQGHLQLFTDLWFV
jgi:hypothetical protein